MIQNWAPVIGDFEIDNSLVVFKGGVDDRDDQPFVRIGNIICDQYFGSGTIRADIKFLTIDEPAGCELIFYYQPNTGYFATAGISSSVYCAIREFTGNWNIRAGRGERNSIKAGTTYSLEFHLQGSNARLKVNGIELLSARLPYELGNSQVGIWCQSKGNIEIANYTVEPGQAKVFVIMQFSAPYDDVYFEVIKKVCGKKNLDVVRVDEEHSSGLIISDIINRISESNILIADITPVNANVFYELGYGHALGKPTILLAEKTTKLPFDISPFRTIFYDNTIGGKTRLEETLSSHIDAILKEKGIDFRPQS